MLTEYKIGQVIQNYQGRYAKIVDIKGTRYGLTAWVMKEADAKEEVRVVRYLNTYGLAQVLPAEAKEEKKAPAKKAAAKEEKKAPAKKAAAKEEKKDA